MTRENIFNIVACMLIFFAGYAVHGALHTCPTPAPEVVTKIEYRDRVQTEIAYVPKETVIYKDASGQAVEQAEKTDVDIKINKPELLVKVNGKEMAIEKAEDEKFLFEKNKLKLEQTSSAALNITLPDNTRRWEIGAGYSKDGLVGQIGFPIAGNVGGWAAGRPGNIMMGVNVKF
jgi:hypothetical protein